MVVFGRKPDGKWGIRCPGGTYLPGDLVYVAKRGDAPVVHRLGEHVGAYGPYDLFDIGPRVSVADLLEAINLESRLADFDPAQPSVEVH